MDTKVIFVGGPGAAAPAELEAVRAVADVLIADTAETLRSAEKQAEIALVWDVTTPLFREVGAGDLAWIHTNSIGVDALLTPELVHAATVITNTRGVYERPMAEFVLAALLHFSRDLHRTVSLQRAHEWRKRQGELIAERRALVLGPGAVGREITTLLRAVGITVDVVGRRARDDEPGLGRVHSVADLDLLLPEADDVIVALPLTADTERILDADRLTRLRRGARIVNVGRGALIDEQALLAGLKSGRIGAAALDVFVREPLPADRPFWDMENVLVSPHMSGDGAGWERRVIDLFLRNLDRWKAGDELENVVDKRAFGVAQPVN
jgi:phosphoglycerate dehydrogenase-like enzyme